LSQKAVEISTLRILIAPLISSNSSYWQSRKSEKNKRHNGQNKKEEKTNNDPQNTREATWTPLKNGNELSRTEG
jgi:hypothetical protein